MLSLPHLVILFIIALLVFGPEKLPELARMLGKAMAEFRRVTYDVRKVVEDEMREIEHQTREADLRKREAVLAEEKAKQAAQNAELSASAAPETPPAPPGKYVGDAPNGTVASEPPMNLKMEPVSVAATPPASQEAEKTNDADASPS